MGNGVRPEGLDKRLVFFDVDSLEYLPSAQARASVLPGLAFRARMLPLAGRLNALYAFARLRAHPMLFSVCCSGQAPTPDTRPDLAHISFRGEWTDAAPAARLYHVEKVPTDHRQGDSRVAMDDKFRRSAGLRQFIRGFAAERWVVFGNGAAYCVHPALECLLEAGQAVTLLSDLLVDNAGDDAARETQAMLARCAARGASLQRFEDFCSASGIPPVS